MFKDKLQELIDKNTVELDADMRAATANAIFMNEDVIDSMNIQGKEDSCKIEGNWVTVEDKATRKRRL